MSIFVSTWAVTVAFEDGRSVLAEVLGRRFGALIESPGEVPGPIVVGSAVPNDAAGVRWATGTNALATKRN